MSDKESKSKEAVDKFMAFMVMSSGGDIIAPEPIFNEKAKEFKYANPTNYVDNDNLTDMMCLLSKVDSQEERVEIIKVLIMKFITTLGCLELRNFTGEYVQTILEYLRDNPDARQKPDEHNIEDSFRRVFGI